MWERCITVLADFTFAQDRALHTCLIAFAVLLHAVRPLAIAALAVLGEISPGLVVQVDIHFRVEGFWIPFQQLLHCVMPHLLVVYCIGASNAVAVFPAILSIRETLTVKLEAP